MTEDIVLQGRVFSVVHRPCRVEQDVYCEDVLIGHLGGFTMIRAVSVSGTVRAFHPRLWTMADVLGWLLKEFEKVEVAA